MVLPPLLVFKIGIFDLANQIEDELAAGNTLEKAAIKVGIKSNIVNEINQD